MSGWLLAAIVFICPSLAIADSAAPAMQDVCELRPDFCSDSPSARKKAKRLIKERKAAAAAETAAITPKVKKKCRQAADPYNLDDDLPLCGREPSRKKKASEEGSLEEFIQAEDVPEKPKRAPAAQPNPLEFEDEVPFVAKPAPYKPRESISFGEYIKNNSNHPALSRNLKTEQTAFQYNPRAAIAPARSVSVETKSPEVGSEASDGAQGVREGAEAAAGDSETAPASSPNP